MDDAPPAFCRAPDQKVNSISVKVTLTKPQLKQNVLKYLYKYGDTFCDITVVILNTGIEQSQIKYLLDELEADKLIVLSRANPHLNSAGVGAHILNAGSNVQARITAEGRDHVQQHLSPSWIDYLEKHPVIRIILILGGIIGLIALIVGLF